MDENKKEVSDLTVIALITSVLIAPVGWFLGFRARKEIERTNSFGRPFATAAIWIGGIITVGMLLMFGLGIAGAAILARLLHDDVHGADQQSGFGDAAAEPAEKCVGSL